MSSVSELPIVSVPAAVTPDKFSCPAPAQTICSIIYLKHNKNAKWWSIFGKILFERCI